MQDDVKKYLSLAVCGVLFYLIYLGKECDRATRNDLYQVWDAINELRKDVKELKRKGKNDEED